MSLQSTSYWLATEFSFCLFLFGFFVCVFCFVFLNFLCGISQENMTSQDRFSVPRSEVGNFLHRNANILLKITNVPWPTAGLACGSQILGLVIDLCGKARGADWITEDFFLVQLNVLASSLSATTDFFYSSM